MKNLSEVKYIIPMNKDTKDFLKAVGLVVAGFILIPTLVIVVGWWMVFLCKLLGV